MIRVKKNPFLQRAVDVTLVPPSSPDAMAWHRSLPGYAPTPLVSLPALATELGVKEVWLKDESKRFALNAFKVLGASYAIYRFLQRFWVEAGRGSTFDLQTYAKNPLPRGFTFATATDGNHGRAVAFTARALKQKAVIFVPGNTVRARIEAIRSEDAEVVVVDGTYDDTVRRAAEQSAKNGWQVISDTAYPGYTEIPGWIMAGYGTIFEETEAQWRALGQGENPDLVLLQAGVGGLAYAGTAHYVRKLREKRPVLVSVEPTDADCLLESIASPDGSIQVAKGKQNSIMAGLNCGTPSLLAWPLIRAGMHLFLAVGDSYAEDAMRRLAAGKGGDPKVVSGESGAAGLAGLLALAREPILGDARREVGIGKSKRILLISTEGDTDPESYRRIVGDPGSAGGSPAGSPPEAPGRPVLNQRKAGPK